MGIQRRILLSIGASLAISFLIVFFVFSNLRSMEVETEAHQVYDKIKDKTYALNLLTGRLWNGQNPSRIRQIREIKASLENLLLAMPFIDLREESLIRQIRQNSRELGYYLEKVISANLKPGSRIEVERFNVLISQLRMKTQLISDDTQQLKEISQSRMVEKQEKADLTTLSLIGALILVNGAIFFLSGRRILKIQEDLKKQREQRQLALDAAKMGWWQYDPVSRILFWDDHYRAIFGVWGYSHPGDETLTRIIHPEDLPQFLAKVNAALIPSDPQPFAVEYRIKRKDEMIRWIEAYGIASTQGEGENKRVVSLFGTVSDITERKESEEALRKSHLELELRVEERTSELEAMNRELQNFTYIASHDLQEPLRKVQIFGEMLLNRSKVTLDNVSRDYIRRMQDAATRMKNLLDTLLTYSRVTSKVEPMTETDLNQCVKEALLNLEILVEEKNAKVEINRLPTIMADETQILQLFQNLIANALKYQRKGEPPRVKIYAQKDGTEKGADYEICIEDNGIGIDEKYADEIFMPFRRLHGRSEYEGVGIGLAICSKIVERHGGNIRVRSEPGKGSTFIVTLPSGMNPR